MKTFVATLAIMAYAGILFESVNGLDNPIKILSANGSYIPGIV